MYELIYNTDTYFKQRNQVGKKYKTFILDSTSNKIQLKQKVSSFFHLITNLSIYSARLCSRYMYDVVKDSVLKNAHSIAERILREMSGKRGWD